MIIGDSNKGIGDIVSGLSLNGIYLGNARYWQWKKPFLFRKRLCIVRGLNPHIAIVGQSGSGKSNACKLIIRQLSSEGVKIAVLDPHGEYLGVANRIGAEVYDAAYNGINIMGLDGVDGKEKTGELSAMFRKVFSLGSVQSYILYKCIAYTYRIAERNGTDPALRDLFFTMKVFRRHADKAEANTLDSLMRKLSVLDSGSAGRSADIGRMISQNSVSLMTRLHTAEAQIVYMEGFLRGVYGNMMKMGKSGSMRLYVVIDEAEKICESKILDRITAEGRKYGIGVISVSQRAKGLGKDVRGNSSLIMAFVQREPEEMNYMANFISGGSEMNRLAEVKRALRNLGRGEAIVLNAGRGEPFICRFDGYSDDGKNLRFGIEEVIRRGEEGIVVLEKMRKEGFGESEVLVEIDRMISEGRIQRYKPGGAEEWYISMPRNSAEHDICIEMMRRRMLGSGMHCYVYDGPSGPDIVAYVGKERVAVEYETGSKSAVQMEAMLSLRRKGYARIVVMVNDEHTKRYENCTGAEFLRFSDFIKGNVVGIICGVGSALRSRT